MPKLFSTVLVGLLFSWLRENREPQPSHSQCVHLNLGQNNSWDSSVIPWGVLPLMVVPPCSRMRKELYTQCINDHSENIRLPTCYLFIQSSEIYVFKNFQLLGWGFFLLLWLFICFICFLGFIVVFHLVCVRIFFLTFFVINILFFHFRLSSFLLAEICMTSFQDKLLGIADQ